MVGRASSSHRPASGRARCNAQMTPRAGWIHVVVTTSPFLSARRQNPVPPRSVLESKAASILRAPAMKYKGLIITLLAGAVVAGGAYTVTTNLSHNVADTGAWRDGGAKATAGITQVASASPSAANTPSKEPEGRHTFAGTTDGGQAGLALAINRKSVV